MYPSEQLFAISRSNKSPTSSDNANMSVSQVSPGFGVTGQKSLNVNRYATKKTLAQGMLDIALLTANASQLKYVLTLGSSHQFYGIMLGLIITSLVLQFLTSVISLSLSLFRDCCLDNEDYAFSAAIFNQINLIATFLISVINIFISGFGIVPTTYLVT